MRQQMWGEDVDEETISKYSNMVGRNSKGLPMEEVEKKPEFEQPTHSLRGPLAAPDAPATYKALTTLRLRQGPSRFADVLLTATIEPDRVFHVSAAKDEEDEYGVIKFLRVDEDDLGDGWVMDTGVAGKFAGKRVVKRVAGSLGKRRAAIHQISQMEADESVTSGSRSGAKSGKLPIEILEFLNDPQVIEVCNKAGVDPETLRGNPGLLKAITARL